ncbi:uncharacterized protein A4U43_C03F6320 [Asparagus officinalis]|uniref:Uncharacterized protein n=1 Tax=Asparagus officinalis TaxID=4686 RepID=A0A5P1F7U0_ASPOF|nr:uncharacterized protein A4U43_C03F6320 [Asparagus officinalis]
MASNSSTLLLLLLLLISSTISFAANECSAPSRGECYDKPKALKLKLIAIATILISSMIGVCLPLFTRSIPALSPDRNLFALVKAFASGVILATGYMHVLPDSFDNLSSPCLPESPWRKFPFTAFVAMLSAVFTLMVDSLMLTFYKGKSGSKGSGIVEVVDCESPLGNEIVHGHGHGHGHGALMVDGKDGEESRLRRNRIIAQVLEMGIVVHSVAEYGLKMKSILAFFFATTTPFGIALGIALTNVYSDSSPTALIVEGLLNACSAGLLNYMALVDLLAADFMGPKLQSSIGLQLWSFAAVLFGAGGMSLMAKWA